MRSLLEYFLKRTLLVNILVIAIFLMAIWAIFHLKKNAYPLVDLGLVNITTEYRGASPKDVEQNVTRLIEDELKGIAARGQGFGVGGECNCGKVGHGVLVGRP